MFRGGRKLTQAELKALEAEVERISLIKNTWEPTVENLAEVLLAVKDAGQEEHKKKQSEGINRAKKNGVVLGRPKIEPPRNIEGIFQAVEAGSITKRQAAKLCEVGYSTFIGWWKEFKENEPN